MTSKKCMIVNLSALLFVFNSNAAMAVEADNSTMIFPLWPLAALLVGLIVFRKKLFAEASIQPAESEHQQAPSSQKEAAPVAEKAKPTKEKEEKPKVASKKKTTAAKKTATTKKTPSETATINLITDSAQCQASTAKGTRCKRTTTLEKSSVTIEGTKYQLTVCRQHNKDAIKPFSELIS